MPLVYSAGLLRYAHHFKMIGDAEEMVTTCAVQLTSTQVAPQPVLDAIHNAGRTMWAGLGPTNITLVKTMGYFHPAATKVSTVFESIPSQAGGNAPPTFPPNCAFLIKKSSTLAGRAGKGRWYFPGVREGSVDDVGTITGATVTSTTNLFTSYRDTIKAIAGVADLVLVHNRALGQADAEFWSPSPITNMICDPRIATQRQRLRR